MSHPWTDRLSEYLDGALSGSDRAALEAHLASCAECEATLTALRAVVARAQSLPDRAPDADLWPGIAARLRPRRAPLRLPALLLGGRRLSFSVPQLAAAAVVLMLLTAGSMWLVLGRRAPAGAPSPGITAPLASAPSGADSQFAAANFGLARYGAAIADLERVLSDHRSDLDPATVRVIESNLRIIDRATDQARRALAADPANPYLNGHLADQMRRKVELLRQVTALIHTS